MKPTVDHPFRSVRRAGVPLSLFETADPAATILSCCAAMNGKADSQPIFEWDIVRAFRAVNEPAKIWLDSLPDYAKQGLGMPAECLRVLAGNPPNDAVVFLHNFHRFWDEPGTVQALWLCRDTFKSKHASLVMLSPGARLPVEIARDVVTFNEPLPTADELGKIVTSICDDAKIEEPKDGERDRALDTLLGLSAFEAEQVLSLSLTKDGLNQSELWERKVKAIEATPGLTVYRGKEKYSNIGGLQNAKDIIGRTIVGKSKISCLVFADELDKGMAASGSDMSGTTQDQLKALLCYMQDNDILGGLFLGPPGTGKTLLAKAAANEYGIPLIMLDLGALKGSLVGQSEQNMRQALKVIHAISAGRALFIGACNRTEGIPPELRRRYSYASIFFDLPDEAERKPIWKVQAAHYELPKSQCDAVNDDGWAGSEIRNCCLKAWAMDCKLSEAAATIVPVSKSASEIVQALRKSASGKYISASKPGVYSYRETTETKTTGRKIDLT